MTDAKKALLIIKAWHDLTRKGESITISKDFDENTLTIETNSGHNHYGVMGRETKEGFSALIDDLYRCFTI